MRALAATTEVELNSNDATFQKLLDEALLSNVTAANLILGEIKERRENGEQGGVESILDNFLCLTDGDRFDYGDVNASRTGFPFWTNIRFFGKFSRRARRASLHRVLNMYTSFPEDNDMGIKTDDDTVATKQKIRRGRALVSLIQSLAVGSTDNDGGDDEVASTPSKIDGIAILNVERVARKEKRNAASYEDILSRVPSGLESPKYSVVKRKGMYEVRDYDAFSVCSVPMNKPRPSDNLKMDQPLSNPKLSGASSFGALAGYLFGKNTESTAMKMTTPVLTGDEEDGSMSFILPSTYWDAGALDNAPKPLEGSLVTLRRDDGGNRAVVMFGGLASKGVIEARSNDLRKNLESDIEWIAAENTSVALAQYNDPFTPPWKRRNEVSLTIVKKVN